MWELSVTPAATVTVVMAGGEEGGVGKGRKLGD